MCVRGVVGGVYLVCIKGDRAGNLDRERTNMKLDAEGAKRVHEAQVEIGDRTWLER